MPSLLLSPSKAKYFWLNILIRRAGVSLVSGGILRRDFSEFVARFDPAGAIGAGCVFICQSAFVFPLGFLSPIFELLTPRGSCVHFYVQLMKGKNVQPSWQFRHRIVRNPKKIKVQMRHGRVSRKAEKM